MQVYYRIKGKDFIIDTRNNNHYKFGQCAIWTGEVCNGSKKTVFMEYVTKMDEQFYITRKQINLLQAQRLLIYLKGLLEM